tara:strand:- start:35 stop:1837 length:1803 start_codon:yes stop_codon:yes gene_type:complete
MSNVAKITAQLDATQAKQGLKGLTQGLGGVKGAALAVGAAVGVAAVAGVAAFAKSSISAFAEAGDEVQKMALRTGFSTEALSELRHAAELSGTSISSMENGVKRMQRTLLDAEQGLSTAVDAMELLGVNMDDVAGKSPEEQFRIMTEALAGVEDASKRSAIAQQVFGRAGTQLLPMLAAGKQGLADMRQEAHDLGIVFDQESADSAAEYQDSLTRLKGAFQGIQFAVGKALVPALIPLVEKFTEVATIAAQYLGPSLKVLGVAFNVMRKPLEIQIGIIKIMLRLWLLVGEELLNLAQKVPFLGAAIEKLGEVARAFSENWRTIFDEMISTVEGWANSVIRAVNELIEIIPEDIASRLGITPLNEIELPRLKAQTEAAEVAISGLELASEELATTAAAASKVISEQVEELTEADKRIAHMNATWAKFSTSVEDNELAMLENIEAQFDQGHAYNALRDQIHRTIADEEKLTEAREAEAEAAQEAADKVIAAAQRMQQEGNRQLARAGVTNAYFDSSGALQTIAPPTSAQRAAGLGKHGIDFGDGSHFGRLSGQQLIDRGIVVEVSAGIWEHDEAALGKAIAEAINTAANQTGPVLSSKASQS